MAIFSGDIPSFFMHDQEGRFYGLDVDLARGIAEALGVEVVFNREAQSFNEIIEILVGKEADVGISWLSKTLERSEKILYTRPYITLYQGQSTDQANTLRALNRPEARIGVKKGTAYVNYARQIFPNAAIMEYPEWDPEIVEAVLKGELTVGYHDEIEIKKYMIRRPEASIQLNTAIIQDLTDPIAMAVPSDSHTLLNCLRWNSLFQTSCLSLLHRLLPVSPRPGLREWSL